MTNTTALVALLRDRSVDYAHDGWHDALQAADEITRLQREVESEKREHICTRQALYDQTEGITGTLLNDKMDRLQRENEALREEKLRAVWIATKCHDEWQMWESQSKGSYWFGNKEADAFEAELKLMRAHPAIT